MKRVLILSCLCYFASCVQAQTFAIVNDKDGYVNVRKDRSINSPIIGKIVNDNIIDYSELQKSDWVRIYEQSVEDESGGFVGFVHKSRIIPLSTFKTIKHINFFKDSCLARNDAVKISIKFSPFNPKTHKLLYKDGELKKIDEKSFWGTDGEIPKNVITSLKVAINGIAVSIPKNAFNNLYEPRLKSLKVFIGTNNTIYIELDNSDGAGAYTVIWTIKDKRYVKKFLESNA